MEISRAQVTSVPKFQKDTWNSIVSKVMTHNMTSAADANTFLDLEREVPALLKHCAAAGVTTHNLSEFQYHYCAQPTELKPDGVLVRHEGENKVCKYYANPLQAAETAWDLRAGP